MPLRAALDPPPVRFRLEDGVDTIDALESLRNGEMAIGLE
jgi:hypothetical protein